MKIHVKADGITLCIPFPTRLLCNSLAIRIANRHADISIPPRAGRAIYREIRRLKCQNPDWNLVELQAAGGETVWIRL